MNGLEKIDTIRADLKNYLTDWRIQNSLHSTEIKSYVRLYEKLVATSEDVIKTQDAISYLIGSPVKDLTSNRAYYTLLYELQKKLVATTDPTKIDNKKQFIRNIATEAYKVNNMSKPFAKLAVDSKLLVDNSIVSLYANIQAGNEVNLEDVELKQANLPIFFKTRRIPA